MYDMNFLDELAYTNPKLYNELIYELYLHIKFLNLFTGKNRLSLKVCESKLGGSILDRNYLHFYVKDRV
jgi:hypothetical protein